jgi:hypothetical protein
VPARVEGTRIGDGGRKGTVCDDADAGDRLQALAQFIRAMLDHDLAFDLTNAGVNVFELGKDQADAAPRQLR